MEPALPTIVALTREQCEALLANQHVGRIAYFHRQVVDIEPIFYVYDDGWIFGRTSHGTKLEMLQHQPWVAFEVDDVRGEFDWQSVVVHGSFRLLTDTGSEPHRELHARAAATIQRVAPKTFTSADPTPHRGVVFGIAVNEMTGRKADAGY